MKYLKKAICILLIIAMTASEAVTLTSCGNKESFDNPEGRVLTDQQGSEENDSYSVDVSDTNYTITILAPDDFTEEGIKGGIEFKNISSPLLTDVTVDDVAGKEELLIKKTGSGEFSLSAKDGFNKGQSYQIELTSEKLSFKNQNEKIRKFGITIAKEDVSNIQLSNSVKRLHANELSKSDADKVLKGDGVFKVSSDGTTSKYNTQGSFDYDSKAFKRGDIVAVYNGNVKNGGLFDESNENVAYVEITAVNEKDGGEAEYVYAAAEAEDIIFIPDMLPVKADCNLKKGETGSMTLSKDTFDYSAEKHPEYAPLGLNDDTVVEAGDFIAFYSGQITRDDSKGETNAYAKILSVRESGSDYVIKYQVTDFDEVQHAIEYHQTSVLSPDEIAEAIDEEKVQQAVLDQFNESKVLSESAISLAKQAYETEEFRKAFGDTPMEELTFSFGDEEEKLSLSGKKVLSESNNLSETETKGDKKFRVSPDIIHFAGATSYGTGVRIEMYGVFTIKVTSEKTKAAVKIDLTLFMEQEILLGLTVDVSMVWGCKWGFIYYPRDIAVSGSLGVGSFTGFGFAAKATLYDSSKDKPKDEDEYGIDWPEDIDFDARSEKIVDFGDRLKEGLDKYKNVFPGAQATAGDGFESMYKGFVIGANKSWVDVCDVPLVDEGGPADPLHLLSFRFKIDFVVSLQLNAAAGVAVGYERSYKYCFRFSIFHHDTESNSSTKDTDLFRGDAYIFGMLGARAGFRLKFSVGLIDTRIDSIGLIAEIGAYAKFTGFLFASTEIKDSNTPQEKRTDQALGALLLDGGFYATLSVFAELGDGALSYVKQVASIELPVLKLGETEFATDFSYEQKDDAEISFNFHNGETTSILPTNIFELKVMNIENAVTSKKNYALEREDLSKYFDIKFSDPNLKYTLRNGKHCVEYTGSKETKQGEGTVTITFKPQRLQFNTMPPQRTFKYKWQGGITLLEFVNGFDNSLLGTVSKPSGTPLTKEDYPEPPDISGYVFDGWEGGLPEVMPEKDTKVIARYERRKTPFNVIYHIITREKLDLIGNVDVIGDLVYANDTIDNPLDYLKEHKLLRVDAGYPGGADARYDGYVIDKYRSPKSITISPDGSTKFDIYLVRDEYAVTYKYGESDYYTRVAYYNAGSPISFPKVEAPKGYVLSGWKDAAGKMVDMANPPKCTANVTYEAVFVPGPPVLEVTVQLKEKSVIGIYRWRTIAVQDLTFNKDEIVIRKLLKKLKVPYFYSSANAKSLDDVIKINEGGYTEVTIRFE